MTDEMGAREIIARSLTGLHKGIDPTNPLNSYYWAVADKILANLASSELSIAPPGSVVVPKEPTPAMRWAFNSAQGDIEAGDVGPDGLLISPDHQWRAMIAAAEKDTNK